MMNLRLTFHPTVMVNITKVLSFGLGIDFVAANIHMERLSQAARFGG